MTFQSLDDDADQQQHQSMEHQNRFYHQPGVGFEYQQQMTEQEQKRVRDEMHQQYSAPRPYTPSMINKPAPIIPHYQMNLSVEECHAANSEIFDPARRSPSPLPMGRCKAQGPPPNPLKALQAQNQPQVLESSKFSEYQQKDQQNWMAMQGASESTFLQRPEQVQQSCIGNMNVQTKANESHLNQNQRMEAQSQSVQQMGNSQVQRRTRVVEEFERSQTAKTVEIRTNGDGTVVSSVAFDALPKINVDEMPPRGIVASQARRFSQDVTGTSSASAAATTSSVGAKVQNIQSGAPSSSFFPTGPAAVGKSCFPVASVDDRKGSDYSPVIFPPPGFGVNCSSELLQKQQKCVQELKEKRMSQKSKQFSQSIASSSSSYAANKPFSYTATSDLNAITIPSITQFKPMNTNKGAPGAQEFQTNKNNLPTPSPLVFPPTMNNLAHQQQQQQQQVFPTLPPLTAPLSFSANSSTCANGTAAASSSLSSTFAAASTAAHAAANHQQHQSGAASVPSSGANCSPYTNNNNKNNNNKGGAGITVGPKRGHGIMNKAVPPGGRVPLCGCCNSQIRLAMHLACCDD